ncbi:MAG TPA: YraN family protein [Actinomycetaceae bacterium]|nr:YraN family protein [Actinomycetaceae bacterium]
MSRRGAVGRYGESVAARILTAKGYDVLDRNWRCSQGEIDIIARDGQRDELVFVEVKTRRGDAFGHPAEAVVGAKLARLRRLAALWLTEHTERAAGVRIDVIAVWPRPAGAARIEHIIGVG